MAGWFRMIGQGRVGGGGQVPEDGIVVLYMHGAPGTIKIRFLCFFFLGGVLCPPSAPEDRGVGTLNSKA